MNVSQRDVWWSTLPDPVGSEAGYRRPVIIVQNDTINITRLATYLCIPMTAALQRQAIPWNLLFPQSTTGLPTDSVAQTSLLFAIDQSRLIERTGRITEGQLQRLFARLDIALGRHGV
ncbi:MAG: type II toxin-antitoxin system PemK/MazF family toxin [Sphingomonadaceae bacterium]